MSSIRFASAVELQRMLKQREISAVEVLEAHLAAIARYNPGLNTIITLDEEKARQRAKEIDATLNTTKSTDKFLGIPYTVKDMFDTAGVRSTFGYLPFINRIPDTDSTVAAKLKEAGGVLLGKTNVRIFPDNPFGRTNNPWDKDRYVGGSSSGAAAVAAGLTPLDIGSDTGGSILGPASDCGIFGMRPTEHRVSVAGYVIPEPVHVWRVMSVAGPMARSVADLKLALEILSGPDNRDHDVPPVTWKTETSLSLKDLRFAWADTFSGAKVQSEISQSIEKLASEIDKAGAKVGKVLPSVDFIAQNKLFNDLWNLIVGAFDSDIPLGKESLLKDYFLLLSQRDNFIASWERFFSQWDVLLCPVKSVTAQLHDAPNLMIDGEEVNRGEYAQPTNFLPATGHPVVVLPAGKDRKGLPFGVGLVGKRWDDEQLLAIASLLEEMMGGFVAPPGYE